MAERRERGKRLDVVPVAWTTDWHQTPSGPILHVHFKSAAEAKNYNVRPEPFVVAIVRAKDNDQRPKVVAGFATVVQVMATGHMVSERTIATTVMKRLRARQN